MKEKEILKSLKDSIDKAPIDLLDDIKKAPRTKMLKHDQITRQETKSNPFKKFMPYASIAAAFLLVFFGWNYQTRMPDSHIFIDVNPSIEITTNRINKVIDIGASNKDGKSIIKDFNYKGMTVDQVTEEILDRMYDEGYFNKDHKFLLLSIYNKNGEKSEIQKLKMDKKIHEHMKKKSFEPIVLSQKLEKTSSIESFSREYGISISKMTFIRNLLILNPELETKELVSLTIEELVSLSQGMGIDLDKILDSTDFEKIGEGEEIIVDKALEIEEANSEMTVGKEDKKDDEDYDDNDDEEKDDDDDDDTDDDDYDDDEKKALSHNIISIEQAKKIALSRVNGKITDVDFDEDDLEYEIEIELDDIEYEITIDGKTGEILEVEVDD